MARVSRRNGQPDVRVRFQRNMFSGRSFKRLALAAFQLLLLRPIPSKGSRGATTRGLLVDDPRILSLVE